MTALERRVEKLTLILDIAKAMTEERDLDRLLRLVCHETTRVLDSERSSLFMYDRDRDELWSRVAEGASEIRFSARTGIAGAVVQSGTVSNIADAYEDPRFNRAVDSQTGFHSHSVLTAPMKDTRGDTVGVLQTLNKHGPDGRICAFDREDEEILLALAGVTAAAVMNAVLYEEIGRLFEGFTKASVEAIDSRDPSTAGHSRRVAQMTLALAEAVDRGGAGRWQDARFTRDQMQELRYAALLHDFGKVGVREHVLVKANKLYPDDLTIVVTRFETIRRALQVASLQRKLELAIQGGEARDRLLEEEDARLAAQLQETDGLLEFIRTTNRPTVLPEGSFGRLRDIAARTFVDTRGQVQPFLSAREAAFLAIRKGSLSDEERQEIESHVVHTDNFLSRIPWTRTMRNVPEFARGHHEKLSGRGYPRKLQADEIPVQTRMITISDIYDALTAADRPYKRAIPHDQALNILHMEEHDGSLDSDLLRVFIEADIPHHTRPL